MYYEKDANLDLIKDKTVAVIGYGSQGHAHSLNLKESGIKVIVGLRREISSWKVAEAAGLTVTTVDKATEAGDMIMILTPDHSQADIYREEVAPGLKAGNVLMFAHGFSIHFNQIVPPADVDVVMVAPKGPGHLVRRQYQEGRGGQALIAV